VESSATAQDAAKEAVTAVSTKVDNLRIDGAPAIK
jgi:hypothetical protein